MAENLQQLLLDKYLQRLPLYQSEQHKPHIELENANKGLLFDRWFGSYYKSDSELVWEVDKEPRAHHPLMILSGPCGDLRQLERARDRQLSLITALNGAAISCELDWNMVTGTGEPHPLENGFRWHYTLGVPYLPASSIKGMLRAWLSTWASDALTKEEVLHLFGNERESSKSRIGALHFFDALPIDQPHLTLDVITPHCGGWYEKGASHPGQPDTVPADWQSPVPITFLAIKKASFLFTLAARDEQALALLPKIMDQLADALLTLGIGAKTAQGYGIMRKKAASEPNSGERLLKNLQEKRQQQQAHQLRQMALAKMSDNQRRVAELEERICVRDDKQFKEGFNNEIAELVNVALSEQWPSADRQALVTMIQSKSVWLQISKKDKARERKALLAQLGEP